MGNVASILKTLNCEYCSKYVFNACKVHSKCSDCCLLDIETTEVEISQDSDSDISVELNGCFSIHKT